VWVFADPQRSSKILKDPVKIFTRVPPMNAVKTILPQFHSLYNAPRAEPVKEYVPLPNVSSPPEGG